MSKEPSTQPTLSIPYTLHSYWRSSTAYRVRIALNLKQLEWQSIPVNLVKGEQSREMHKQLNPQGLVPVLSTEQHVLTQSLAIIEYLEETEPSPALLPEKPAPRAFVRSMAYQIAMEMHPLNNLRVLNYLATKFGCEQEQRVAWIQHWIEEGFAAFENTLQQHSNGQYCYGKTMSLADVCLIPQVYNAKRFGCDLTDYPLIQSINDHCLAMDAFIKASPEQQPDSQAA